MNNQQLFDNYLLVLKSTVEVYVHGTLESSNKDIRLVLKKCLDDTLKHQADTYDKMKENNWYNVQNIASKDICKIINKINNQ